MYIAFGVILKDFRVCTAEKGDRRGEGARLVLLYKTRRYGWLHLYGEISTTRVERVFI